MIVMTEKTVVIGSSLDARQAALFVQTASKFDCNIQVAIGDKKINAKSIMGTIALGIVEGQTAVITADGRDEGTAAEELCRLLA